jgi:hypothetical protein
MSEGTATVRRSLIVLLLTAVFLGSASVAFAGHPLLQADGDRYHWADNDPSFPRGYVYWQDQTGAEWPVYSSAIEWDKASRLDAVYTSGSCTSSHCVTVREVSFNNVGCAPPYGETSVPTTTAGHFTTDTEVRIDAQCDNRNAADRRELVCHEMGHSIGLGERASSSATCMRTGNMVGRTLPDGHDYEALYNSYDHND